jgi:suppressor of G2 allele of SKP1
MATEAYNEGNALFVDGRYDAALEAYSRALQAEPNNPLYFDKRAAAHMRLGNYIDAVADVSKSLKSSPSVLGFVRKGEALFQLDEFDTALIAFRKAVELAPDSIETRRWIRKCEVSRRTAGRHILSLRSARLSSPLPSRDLCPCASALRPQAELAGAVVVLPPAKPSASVPLAAPAAQPPATKPAAPVAPTSDPSRVRHEWYQTLTHVVVTILVRGASEDAVHVKFDRTELTAEVTLPGGHAEYQLHLSLFGPINAAECEQVVEETKIVLKLKKDVNCTWSSLEGKGDGGLPVFRPPAAPSDEAGPSSAPPPEAAARPAYPTSRPKKTDWDKVEHEVTREEEETKLEGDEALQKLFRDIYARSSDETRRAMNKSFQTSGGTVLSTNWEEVAKKDYEQERSAPDGQEWKKWG